MASSWVDGGGFLAIGDKDPFPAGWHNTPLGYPMFLGLLEKVGLGNNHFFVFSNILFTVGAIVFFFFVIIRQFHFDITHTILVSVLGLLSWILIKHVTIPLNDPPYFFLSGATLFLLTVGETQSLRRAVVYWLLGALFIFASIAVRTIGVCILPALIWAIYSHPSIKPSLNLLSEGRRKVLVIAFPILSFLATYYFISSTLYFEWLVGKYQSENWTIFSDQILFRTTELGAIFSNLPPSKLPNIPRVIFILIGFLAFLAIFYGILVRIKNYKIVDVYFASYVLVVLVWPYPDERFWLPILPLLFVYALIGIQQLGKISIPLVAIWFSGFSMAGFIAIGYSTFISLSGDKFPDRYGASAYSYRHSYYEAYGINREIDYSQVNHRVVRLLQKYDSRSKGTTQN